MITLDGSSGEGGGQILRNAIAYAALFQEPLRIHSIRARRKSPGIRAQHKSSLEIAVEICGGELSGANIGSNSFEFHPVVDASSAGVGVGAAACGANDDDRNVNGAASAHRKTQTKQLVLMDIGTAGSICLLLQVALPCWIFNSSKVKLLELRGGTNASLAPQIDYLSEVLLPILSKQCFGNMASLSCLTAGTKDTLVPTGPSHHDVHVAHLDIQTRGYYPVGNGVVRCCLNPSLDTFQGPLQPITLMERGNVISISIQCFYAGKVPRFVASRMAHGASKYLKTAANDYHTTTTTTTTPDLNEDVSPSIDIIQHDPAVGSASGILIIAKTNTHCIFGASALGHRNEKPERTGEIAAQELVDNLQSGGCVDEWLQDQLIIYMALAAGESKIRTGCLTLHTITAIDVARQMTQATFDVIRVDSGSPMPDHQNPQCQYDSKGRLSSTKEYGKSGCIPGQHIITCQGIGYTKVK